MHELHMARQQNIDGLLNCARDVNVDGRQSLEPGCPNSLCKVA